MGEGRGCVLPNGYFLSPCWQLEIGFQLDAFEKWLVLASYYCVRV